MKEWIVKDTLNNKYVQELIRCRDCKHGRKHNIDIVECMKAHDYNLEHQEFHHKNWFCADGRRRTVDA